MTTTKIFSLLLLFIIGLVIVILPDNNERVFSLSEDHGPSLQDITGLTLLLCPYIYTIILAWRKRQHLKPYQNTTAFKLGSILFVLGLALVIVSVLNDVGSWWLLGAAIMFVY